MSTTAQVDYDALAKQYGATASQPAPAAGTVDYDALAKQYGATSSESASPTIPEQTIGHAAKSFLGDLWDSAKGLYKTVTAPPQTDAEKVAYAANPSAGVPLLRVGKGYYDSVRHLLDNAEKAGEAGDTHGAMVNTIAAGLPLVGPLAGDIYEQAKSGDTAGAIGKGLSRATQVASMAPEGSVIPNPAAAVGDVVAAGLKKAAPALAEKLQTSATTQYQQALNPTKERTKFIADKRTPEMLERGVTGSSPADIASQARAKASASTKKLNDIYESLPEDRQSPTAPMLKALEDYKAQFQDSVPVSEAEMRTVMGKNRGHAPENIVKNEDGSFSRVINIDENAVSAADKMKDVISQYGDTINPKSMRKVRQIFDESVAKAGGFEGRALTEGSLLDARKEAASAIREQLAKDNPEIVPLNKEINFWLDVQRVAAETSKRRVGQQGGLSVQMAKRAGQVVGGGVGLKLGGPAGAALGAYAGGELLGNIAAVTRSTKWRTVSAVEKASLARALSEGNFRVASAQVKVIARRLGVSAPIGTVAVGSNTDQPQETGPER